MRDRELVSLTATDGIRLDLFWRHDRYAHRIIAISGGEERLLVESVDGSDEDAWPPSPPLQQLSIEEHQPGQQVALLVGMAGKSHWSLSIEPQPHERRFVFDVACRSREPAGRLGSTYQVSQVSSESQIGLEIVGLEVDGGCSSPVALHESQWLVQPRSLAGQTIRWKYAVHCLDHPAAK